MSDSISASIVGASGFTGGELLRILAGHPRVRTGQISSRRLAGRPAHTVHPNLRGVVDAPFCNPDDIEPCDVLFLCMPHGAAASELDRWRAKARLVIDLSADHRLNDPAEYQAWYGQAHPNPGALAESVYGLPEIKRDRLQGATLISGVGCNATAMTLALLPLARAGLVRRAIADIKVGSSEAGADPGPGSHHPVRDRTVRVYSPSGHRHLAEVRQSLGDVDLDATISAVGMVRGAACAAHVDTTEPIDTKRLWRLYREAYAGEPFVRIVADRSGPNRLPDPRVVTGSNFADVGFTVDERSGRVLAVCAIDNLVKGAAGSAVQSMNIALGFDERDGLAFPGLHPA